MRGGVNSIRILDCILPPSSTSPPCKCVEASKTHPAVIMEEPAVEKPGISGKHDQLTSISRPCTLIRTRGGRRLAHHPRIQRPVVADLPALAAVLRDRISCVLHARHARPLAVPRHPDSPAQAATLLAAMPSLLLWAGGRRLCVAALPVVAREMTGGVLLSLEIGGVQ